MACTFSGVKDWSVTKPVYTANYTLDSGDTGFTFTPTVTPDIVVVRDTAAIAAGVPIYTVANGVVTVTGCTANGSGTIAVWGDVL